MLLGFLGFLSGTGAGVVSLVGKGARAGVRRSAMESDGVERASETVYSRSRLAIVSSHGVGLGSAPLFPGPTFQSCCCRYCRLP